MENLKEIKSLPITGKESLKELLKKACAAHLSRDIRDEALKSFSPAILESRLELREILIHLRSRCLNFVFDINAILRAYDILERAVKEHYTVFLTFAGALTPADFGTSCLIPLMERGIIDCITTTGANIYHEIQRIAVGKFYEYALNIETEMVSKGDLILAEEKYSRIYNIIFPEKDLHFTDNFIHYLFSKCRTVGSNPFSEIMEVVGYEFSGSRGRNWISLAREYGIPIFCGAPQDSGLFFHSAYKRLKGELNFRFDIERDINEIAVLQYLAQKKGKFAIIILGGGVPKNFTLQAEPYLSQKCGLQARGFDADIQISMADVRDGGLSSCPANEGHTWGKVSGEGMKNSVYIAGEILSVFPLLVYEVRRKNLMKGHKSLYDKKDKAVDDLREDVLNNK